MFQSLRTSRAKSSGRRLAIAQLEARLAPAANPIVAENLLPGNPQSEWGITGSGDSSLQGYATNFSVNKGETVSFKVADSANAPYRIDIYRIGYYQGNGARKVDSIPSSQTLRQNQPAPIYDPVTNLVDAGNWSVSASWTAPPTAVSGVYIARLVREDTGGASHILFVVRDDSSQSDVLFQTADTTWQAYNRWGGWSLYGGTNGQRATKVSYNRPFSTRTDTVNGRDYFFGVEYAQVRWLEANGYNVSYFSGIDGDRYGSEIREHKLYMTAGHDEYWSGPQRTAVEAARDAGVNLAFLTGNDMYWKIRWENSVSPSGGTYRTMVCYKESIPPVENQDPSAAWTGLWRDPRYAPADAGVPENALTGTIFTVNRGPGGETGTSFTVPEADGKMRFWRDTSVANLAAGQKATLGDQVLGYEWNEDLDNGYRPAGLFQLSSTTQTVPEKLMDYGKTVAAGPATHSLTMYKAKSGAIVFSAGTVQWAWGLDGVHDGPITTPDPALRQATVNLLADMGVQPESLQPGLIRATASTDAVTPTAVITSPAGGTVFSTGQTYTISGTASDGGGGRVAAVEVSTDGGFTWRRAAGRGTWSYTWAPSIPGPVTVRARAIDDSGNMEDVGAAVSGTVQLAASSTTGKVGEWALNEPAGSTTAADTAGTANPGTVSGGTFGGGRYGNGMLFDGVNDWVTVADHNDLDLTGGMTLSAWVRPSALTDYSTVVMKERSGGLVYTLYAADGANQPPSVWVRLTSGEEVSVRGTAALPLNAWSHLTATYDGAALKLFVNGQLVGNVTAPGDLVTSTGALRIGGNSVWGEHLKGFIDEVRVYGRALSDGEIAYDLSTPAGGGPAQPETTPPTGAVTFPAAGATVAGTVTVTASASDNVAVAGVQFLVDGQPVGPEDTIAPYAYPWDTRLVRNGSHTLAVRVRDGLGNVFTSAATTVTVGNPVDTLKPTVRMTLPLAGSRVGAQVALEAFAADNTAVAGVQFKVNGVNVGPEDTSAPYRISWDASTLAAGTYDVVAVARDLAGNLTTSAPVSVTVDGSAPTVTATAPAAGATGVSTTADIQVTFSEAVDLSAMSFALTTASGTLVATQMSYDSATRTASFSPNGMARLTQYTATLSGVKDVAGNPMAGPVSWSFTTAQAAADSTLWDDTTTPAVASTTDTAPIEVGLKFRADVGGYITGIRFYKGPANTGTHVGHLWSAAGALLGSVTFAGEAESGWQRADFATPVAVQANTTYVISYYAPNGGYSHTGSYFGSDLVSGHLTALSSANGGNGVYKYAAGGAFPNESFGAANYWVAPVFNTVVADVAAPTVTAQTPAPGATEVGLAAGVAATFSESVQSGTIVFTLKTAAGIAVAGTVTYNDAARTVTFQPTSPLAINGSYTATVSGAKDLAGNPMAAVSWSFATLTTDTTAPSVVATTPLANATGVAPAVQVTARFSESVQPASISLKVLDGNNNEVPAAVSYNDVTRTVSVFPLPPDGRPAGCCGTCSHCPLAASTTYTAKLTGATDLAGNTMAPVNWTFTTDGAIVNDSIWGPTATPAVASANDFAPIELGVRIRPEKTGYLTGIKFYKGQYNTGTHLGRVWSGEGTLLDTVTFANETESGWQQANFENPVLVQAGSQYVISYYAPVGGYAYTGNVLTAEAGTGALRALASTATAGNGLYRYGTGGGFPTGTYNATNYWVDAVFSNILQDLTGPTVVAQTPAASAASVPTNSPVSVTFSENVDPATVAIQVKDANNTPVAVTAVTYDAATRTATVTPTAGLADGTAYTVTVTGAKDTSGNPMAAHAWSFTTGAAVKNATIWSATAVPTVVSAADTSAVELGVKFRADTAGYVTGIRFYKGAANTGTHVGSLWDATGTRLASVTFAGETATGWQQALLSTPVAVAANTTYVVSYHAPNGGYSYDHGYFANVAATASPVKALANGANGGNGLYRYGASGFPTDSYNSTNYWVDVVFNESLGDATAPAVESRAPAAGAVTVETDANVSVTFTEGVVADSVVLTVRNASDALVAGQVTYDPSTRTVVFDPTADLGALRTYTVTVSGAKDAAGNAMAATSWSFSTRGTWLQSTTADFAGGTATGVTVSDHNGGALQLAASFDESFAGTALVASRWSTGSWTSVGGGTTNVAVSGGAVGVAGGILLTTGTYPGVGVEGRVNFAAAPYQHFGLATNLDAVEGRYWAIFSTGGTSSTLFARVNVSGVMQEVNLGALPSGYQSYKIVPTGSAFQFYVNGALATTINLAFPVGTETRFALSAFLGGTPLQADWIKAASHNLTGTFTSAVFDAGQVVNWERISWLATTPTGTTVQVRVSVSTDNTTWSNYADVTNAAALAALAGRYIRYEVTLKTTDSTVTPMFEQIKLDFTL